MTLGYHELWSACEQLNFGASEVAKGEMYGIVPVHLC